MRGSEDAKTSRMPRQRRRRMDLKAQGEARALSARASGSSCRAVSRSRPAYSETASGVKASSSAAISVDRADPAQKIPVRSQRARTAHARFLGHDQRALEAGPHGLELVKCHALAAQPVDFGQHHVQGLLRPVGRSPGVTEHGGSIELTFIAGVNGVAQPAFLADLGEQPGRGITSQDRRGGACPVIVGAGDRRRGIGQRDLDLLGLAEDMVARRAAGAFRNLGSGCGFQSPNSRPTVIAEPRPVDRAGDTQDRPVGPIGLLEKPTQVRRA